MMNNEQPGVQLINHVERLDNTVTKLTLEMAALHKILPDRNTDAGDEFVRQELLSMYECCDGRDATALEYVIRLVSTPDQWAEFYRVNRLKSVIAIGE